MLARNFSDRRLHEANRSARTIMSSVFAFADFVFMSFI